MHHVLGGALPIHRLPSPPLLARSLALGAHGMAGPRGEGWGGGWTCCGEWRRAAGHSLGGGFLAAPTQVLAAPPVGKAGPGRL